MEVFIVNSFVEDGFLGNPAGVCPVDSFPPDSEMKKIASKIGLSETAFIRKDNGCFFIRWWTPETEISLCGHATLAAAYIILRNKHKGTISFVSSDYNLGAEIKSGIIEMDFPAEREKPCAAPAGIFGILGAEVVYTAKNRFDYLIELKNPGDVAQIRPDLDNLRGLECRGIIVTSASDRSGYDFISRFFAPRIGIDEDPVTGSSHCCLAPYWAEKTGRRKLKGLQVSQRGGVVRTEVEGERVRIGGKAVLDRTLTV